METNKPTVIIGASTNPERYSYRAANKLNNAGHTFYPVGQKKGEVFGKTIQPFGTQFNNVDTITMYLNPQAQKEYYNYIFSLQPKRIVFNPGTENPELEELAKQKGIEVTEACTLVLLSTGQF